MEKARQPDTSGATCLIGTLLAAMGGVSYWLLMDNAWIRSTAVPNIALAASGLILCFWSIIRRRSRGIIAGSAVSVLLGGGFLVSFSVLMSLPKASGTTPQVGDAAPCFTLLNQDGEKVDLSTRLAHGPVLLVFYRGHW